jgi:predicted small lipoprotein YifL
MKSARILSLFSLILVLSLTGCTLKGRIYNLDTAEVTPIKFTYSGSGKGTISGTFLSGESFNGDYVTFPRLPINWGKIYGAIYGDVTWNQTGNGGLQQYGTAIASGDKGFVGDCEYVTSSLTHGSGACTDKQGGRYKIMW